MHIHTDILIIGAGPGGTTAAMQLAAYGIGCTIVDKAVFPRDKICGDALSGKVVEVLKKVFPDSIEKFSQQDFQVGSWGVCFFSPHGDLLRVPFKGKTRPVAPPGYLCKRLDFDHFLLQQIQELPTVRLLQGVNLSVFEKTPEGYRCADSAGQFVIQTRLVIAADGAQSRFARHIAHFRPEPAHYGAGIRAYFKNVASLDPDNFIELHFLKPLLPGYFWIFPLPNGMANVGLGMRSDYISKRKTNLPETMKKIILQHPALSKRFQFATQTSDIRGFGLPLGSKKRSLSGDHYLLVGDAAALIDPFTGEGIGNAMLSGMLAARQAAACLHHHNFSAAFNRQYDQKVYQALWDELTLSRTLQQLLLFPGLFNWVVKKIRKSPLLQETISAMFEDVALRSRLSRPSFYINLLFS